MANDIEFLKSIPYFHGMDPAKMDKIKDYFFQKSVERGEIILLEAENDGKLYFVASGAIKTFKTSASGKEQIYSIVRPGESFNDVTIFDDGPNPASAQAMGPALLYGIKRRDFRTILESHVQIGLNTIKVLSEQLRQLVLLVEDLSFKHVIGRVGKIILNYVDDHNRPAQKLTQQEMAAMAGTAREVVARSLKSLEEDGLIKLERNKIIIKNRQALEEIAGAS